MIFSQNGHAILVFPNYKAAILALDQLIVAGFSPRKVSIVGKELVGINWWEKTTQIQEQTYQAPVKVFIGGSNGLRVGCLVGNVLGGVIGLLLGLSVSALPGVSGMMLASKIVFTLSSGFFCTVSGGIIGALIGLRINQKQVKEFNRRVARGEYLIIVRGKTDEINRARRLLKNTSLYKK